MKRHKLQVSDLLDDFSAWRLMGVAAALKPDYVMIDPSYITKIPQITRPWMRRSRNPDYGPAVGNTKQHTAGF